MLVKIGFIDLFLFIQKDIKKAVTILMKSEQPVDNTASKFTRVKFHDGCKFSLSIY
jgi:hypothetical protein